MSRSVTLIELLVFILMAGFFVAGYQGFAEGSSSLAWRLLGGTIGCSSVLVFILLCLGLHTLVFVGVPSRPVCKQGGCRSKDYAIKLVDKHVRLVCGCGDAYKRVGRRFMRVNNRRAEPYMIWRFPLGWRVDEGQGDKERVDQA